MKCFINTPALILCQRLGGKFPLDTIYDNYFSTFYLLNETWHGQKVNSLPWTVIVVFVDVWCECVRVRLNGGRDKLIRNNRINDHLSI